ncbi:MAG: hypothetical protein GY946_04325 [bacterium]|nr:hypothetical protein [bacterium]
MATSAWIVPGPKQELDSPPYPFPAPSPADRPSRIGWALLPAPFVGFALGVALAIAQAPPSTVPDAPATTPPPAVIRPAPGLEPRFWKPAGSTAVRPEPRLSRRHYHPPIRLAGHSTLR